MPDPYTEQEIEDLRQRVNSLELSEREQEISDDIFLEANIKARQREGSLEAESVIIRLRNQFTNAFAPGDVAGFILAAIKIRPSPPKK
jgi:hypothetical protein